MFKRLLGTAIVFGAAALAPPIAEAQTGRCMPRSDLIETLETKYSETLVGGGLQNAQQVVEIWTSGAGSFTVLVTRADGFSCIVAAGKEWHSKPTIPTTNDVKS